jgi:HEPN domain-containing protein
MSEAEPLYRAWLAKADNDILNIQNNLAAERVPWDTVCFHAQQAAEKTLKAVLLFHELPASRTHDLVILLMECVAVQPSLSDLEPDCQMFVPFAVEVRYPGDLPEPEEQDAHELVAAMERIRERVLPLFGQRPDAND